MPETKEKRVQKPRDVDYTLEVVDDLPEIAIQRRSPLNDQIDSIVADEEKHGKYVRIGSYANGSAASAAANVLRKKHGDKAIVDGFEIRVKRTDVEGGVPRTGLFVKYDPSLIVPGEREMFEKRLQAREEKVAARRAEREAAEKNGQGEKSESSDESTDARTDREAATSAGVKTGSAEEVQESKAPRNKKSA